MQCPISLVVLRREGVVADTGQSNFGQSTFGQPIWSANFGQSIFGPSIFLLLCVVGCVVVVFFHTTTRELQSCTFDGSGASNTTKIPRKDPQRERQKERTWWLKRRKREILGLPTLRAPPFGGQPFGAPLFLGLVPLPRCWDKKNATGQKTGQNKQPAVGTK